MHVQVAYWIYFAFVFVCNGTLVISSREFHASCLPVLLNPAQGLSESRTGTLPLGVLLSLGQMLFLEGPCTTPWWMPQCKFEGLLLQSLHVQSQQPLLLLAAFHTKPTLCSQTSATKHLRVACPSCSSFQNANQSMEKHHKVYSDLKNVFRRLPRK